MSTHCTRAHTYIINVEQQMTVLDATYIIIINFKINQIIFKDMKTEYIRLIVHM